MQEKYENAASVIQQKGYMLYEIQRIANGIEDNDLSNRIKTLLAIDSVFNSINILNLLPVEDMMHEFVYKFTDDSNIIKEISKICIGPINFTHSINNQTPGKRKKLYEE